MQRDVIVAEMLALQVIGACGLPKGCEGTLVGPLIDAMRFARGVRVTRR